MFDLPSRAKDLQGQVFGKLTVKSYAGKNSNNSVIWFCQCECGNCVNKTSSELGSQKVPSCGCYDSRAAGVALKNEQNRLLMIGKKFGRLTVLEFESVVEGRAHYLCRCDCGNSGVVNGTLLTSGAVKSCGCLSLDSKTTHGLSNHKLYDVWVSMIQRCCNPNNERFHRYGGRGITVCDDWKSDFLSFYNWATTHGYQDGLTIERQNNDLGYSPNNCTWVTNQIQARNRVNVILTESDVVNIKLDNRSAPVIASDYGISTDHVYRIKSGRYWKGTS